MYLRSYVGGGFGHMHIKPYIVWQSGEKPSCLLEEIKCKEWNRKVNQVAFIFMLIRRVREHYEIHYVCINVQKFEVSEVRIRRAG